MSKKPNRRGQTYAMRAAAAFLTDGGKSLNTEVVIPCPRVLSLCRGLGGGRFGTRESKTGRVRLSFSLITRECFRFHLRPRFALASRKSRFFVDRENAR